MRSTLTICAIVALAGTANAQLATGDLRTFADSNVNGDAPLADTTLGVGRTWTVRSGGVVGGTTGIRFMPIEGSSAGGFAGWGFIEFDPTQALNQIQAEVAATPGATGFVITDVVFRAQQQDSQPFPARSGALELYHTTNDSFNPFSLSGADYFTNQQLGTLGNEVSAVDAAFNYVNTPSANFDFNEPGSDYSAVIADWNSGTDPIRMILNPGDAGVVAPFKGSSSPFAGINAPSFFVSYDIIPSPGAAALLGLAGVAGLRRRRH